jgi:hypothetical protein
VLRCKTINMFLNLIISYPSVDCQYISIRVQRYLILLNAQNPACKSHNRLVTIKETTPQLRIVSLSPPGCRWRRDDRTRRWPLARTPRGDRRGKCKDGSPGRVADERMAGRLSACGEIVVRSYAPSKRATGSPGSDRKSDHDSWRRRAWSSEQGNFVAQERG